jgi:hypothetical protein
MYSLLLSFLNCILHISGGIPRASPDHHLNVPLTVTLTNMVHFPMGINLPMGIIHVCLFFAMICQVSFCSTCLWCDCIFIIVSYYSSKERERESRWLKMKDWRLGSLWRWCIYWIQYRRRFTVSSSTLCLAGIVCLPPAMCEWYSSSAVTYTRHCH